MRNINKIVGDLLDINPDDFATRRDVAEAIEAILGGDDVDDLVDIAGGDGDDDLTGEPVL